MFHKRHRAVFLEVVFGWYKVIKNYALALHVYSHLVIYRFIFKELSFSFIVGKDQFASFGIMFVLQEKDRKISDGRVSLFNL